MTSALSSLVVTPSPVEEVAAIQATVVDSLLQAVVVAELQDLQEVEASVGDLAVVVSVVPLEDSARVDLTTQWDSPVKGLVQAVVLLEVTETPTEEASVEEALAVVILEVEVKVASVVTATNVATAARVVLIKEVTPEDLDLDVETTKASRRLPRLAVVQSDHTVSSRAVPKAALKPGVKATEEVAARALDPEEVSLVALQTLTSHAVKAVKAAAPLVEATHMGVNLPAAATLGDFRAAATSLEVKPVVNTEQREDIDTKFQRALAISIC